MTLRTRDLSERYLMVTSPVDHKQGVFTLNIPVALLNVRPSISFSNIGGSKGDTRDAPLLGVQILSFSCSFGQKICNIIIIWELAPHLRKILDPPLSKVDFWRKPQMSGKIWLILNFPIFVDFFKKSVCHFWVQSDSKITAITGVAMKFRCDYHYVKWRETVKVVSCLQIDVLS